MNEILTNQFSFVKPPKIERNFRDLGFTKKKQAIRRKKKKLISKWHKSRANLKDFKEPTRSQLIKILDGMVSDFVLTKKCIGLCIRCGKRHIQYLNKKGELKWHNYGCSHYWPRDYMGTRFEIDNLDGLCWLPCHSQKWEKSKQGDYKDYMLKKLGKKGYDKLEMKARGITKFSRQDIQLMINNFNSIWK